MNKNIKNKKRSHEQSTAWFSKLMLKFWSTAYNNVFFA